MSLLQTMHGYRSSASWAVWATTVEGDLDGEMEFPTLNAETVVHGRAMIISLNPATGRYDDPEVSPWSNFHSRARKHNDRFLAHAFKDTELWGAYMSDLHPEIAESDSRLVLSTRDELQLALDSLIRQAKLLRDVQRIVCVGTKSYERVVKHASQIESEVGAVRVQRITHYSGMARSKHKNDAEVYRSLVHQELGLQ